MSTISDLNFEAGVAGLAASQAKAWGFRSGERGTHTSRTSMLDELSHLLEAVPSEANREEYAVAVVEHNCLGKRTTATRKLSLQRLTELYALEPHVILVPGAEGSLGKKRDKPSRFWRYCWPWRGTRCSE